MSLVSLSFEFQSYSMIYYARLSVSQAVYNIIEKKIFLTAIFSKDSYGLCASCLYIFVHVSIVHASKDIKIISY